MTVVSKKNFKIEGKLAPWRFGPFPLRPAEFWTPQSVPSGVFGHCRMCPAFSWIHSYRGLNIHTQLVQTGNEYLDCFNGDWFSSHHF